MDARAPVPHGIASAANGVRIMAALGPTQILAWGTTYYLLTVLAAPISADTGWPLTLIVGSLSAALLVAGLASPKVGRLISKHGGRGVLAGGAVLMAAGLSTIGLAPSLPVFLAGWLVIGLAMSASLYDPAFSTLGRIYGEAARRPITTLTLFGGLASAVCWPLSAWLVESVGWRGACLVYAAVQLGFCFPLLLFGLPREQPDSVKEEGGGETAAGRVELSARQRRVVALLSAALVLEGVLVTIVSVHLVTLLGARGVGLAAAVSLGMLIGPAQVGGRVFEMVFGDRYHPIWTLIAASALIATGVVLLYLGFNTAALALLLYGAGNGIWTIARGALPLALFGPRDYPVVMGRLAVPSLVAQAAAPSAGALLIAFTGAEAALALLAAMAAGNVGVAAAIALTTGKLTRSEPSEHS